MVNKSDSDGKFLKVLEIPVSSITDQMVLKHIKPLPKLTTLDISNCLKITRKGIAAFGNQCKCLVNLRRYMQPLEACSPIYDSETKAIAETMPNLKQIDLCFGSWNVELNGDLEERCERLEHFQNPWVNYEYDFCDSGGSDDDEYEEESESD
ncbi:F-BOX WITH WD-40 2 [Artemisia annua]|uniref:F-BOX WITH WD-40 2 n=1 Tax=Artemisia annua TaxID=35608 RepID=A0A2U1LMM3_ARTAN|nr:F-BOX WITH WD-40 2 [Artemisia annua]